MGGQSGAAGGGGSAVDQGTQTIPLDELQKETKIQPAALPIVREAWSHLDDQDRQFVIDANRGGQIKVVKARGVYGDAHLTGNPRLPDGHPDKIQSQGRVRISKDTLDRSPQFAAGVLMHESRHGDLRPGRRTAQETKATKAQLDYHEKGYRRATARGDQKAATAHLESAAFASGYRAVQLPGRLSDDPLLSGYVKNGFGGTSAGHKNGGKFLMDAANKGLTQDFGVGARTLRQNERRMRLMEEGK